MIEQLCGFFSTHCCCCANSGCLQGDLADCFYIVESGQVRITIKRSRVSLTLLQFGQGTETIWNLTAWTFFFSSFARQKKTRRRRRWILRHSPEASISGSWRSSPTSPELHQPMPWEASNAWVHSAAFWLWKQVFLEMVVFLKASLFWQSWMWKPSRGCWVPAWTSWRGTSQTMRSSSSPCLEVALLLSNAARKTSQTDSVWVGYRKLGLYRWRPPPPHNHFKSLYYSLYYKKCEYIHHDVYVLGKCEVVFL